MFEMKSSAITHDGATILRYRNYRFSKIFEDMSRYAHESTNLFFMRVYSRWGEYFIDYSASPSNKEFFDKLIGLHK